jgi:isopenicillin-N N-acyltransferase like protein
MHKIKLSALNLAILLLCTVIGANASNINTPADKQVPVIELSGNGYQRGLQHGKLLKREIGEIILKWKQNIKQGTGTDADQFIKTFYANTNFEPISRKLTPQIMDEVKGIAEGSGQRYIDIFCFQLADELWVYIDRLHHTPQNHCSGMGMAAKNGHPAYLAQNLDDESYTNGYQVLLHIKATKTEPEQYVLTCAGMVAANGINSKSIAVCVNTLMDLRASTDGLPVAFVVRGILSKQNGKDALEFVKNIKHASGQNYIVGVVDSVYDFEASAGKVVRFLPDPTNPSLVYHTNHAIANNDIKPWYADEYKKMLAGEDANDNSVIRYTSLKNRLAGNTDFSYTLIKQTLRSKDDPKNPICNTFDSKRGGFTFTSDIFTLGKQPSIQLTYASPDQSDYVTHTFSTR